jgi:hypothetical protein
MPEEKEKRPPLIVVPFPAVPKVGVVLAKVDDWLSCLPVAVPTFPMS